MFSSKSKFLASLFVVALTVQASAQKCPINSVCFAMDRSGSMRGFYDREQRFVVAVSRAIASRTKDTMYSAFGFAGSSFMISRSTKNLEGSFIPAVNKPVSPKGSTNMYRGLNRCYNELKKQGKGNKNFRRVIVLVTDGEDNGTPRAITLAPKVKQAGISIVTVGIGNNIDRSYLRNVASNDELFVSSSFQDLTSNVVKVAENSCKAPMMTPKPIMPTPGFGTTFAACNSAYLACGLKFKGWKTVPKFSMFGMADRPFTPVIKSRKMGEKIGILNTNHVIPEFIKKDGSAFNISMIGKPRFTPTHFKPFSIAVPMPNLNMTYYGSGVGHQTFHGNQRFLARNRCVRVHFTAYQVLSNGLRPYVRGNVNVKKSDNKCVVFMTS